MRKPHLSAIQLIILIGMVILPDILKHTSAYAQSLDDQAIREAKRAWHSVWTQCGDSYVARYDSDYCIDIACTGGRRHDPLKIVQRKDVYFVVSQSRRLSEADSLNGVSWFGEVRAKWSAEREFNFKSKRWSDWRTPSMNAVFVLERKNSRWDMRRVGMGNLVDYKMVKISCANFSNPSSILSANESRSNEGNRQPYVRSTERGSFKGATIPIKLTVHLEGVGDELFGSNIWAGTKAQEKRLEGFSLKFDPPVSGLSLEYMAHLENIGDTEWYREGEFCGTRRESRRLEGFAIRLTGADAQGYDVFYQAHLQNIGDTRVCKNGEFCGTRGESRRVESMIVWVVRRIRP